jgi:hypothetical protein
MHAVLVVLFSGIFMMIFGRLMRAGIHIRDQQTDSYAWLEDVIVRRSPIAKALALGLALLTIFAIYAVSSVY